jgi:hypothetical protein
VDASRRILLAAAISLAGGVAIGFMDSRPGFDDTGVSAVGLVVVAGVASFFARRKPWAWAILTGVWVPLLELPGLASGGALLALAFSSAGAAIGWFAARK